jgi:hypothetical protein
MGIVAKTGLQTADNLREVAFFANQAIYVRKLMTLFRFRTTRKTN